MYKNLFLKLFFIYLYKLKKCINPPKTAQLWSKNINKQTKYTFVKNKKNILLQNYILLHGVSGDHKQYESNSQWTVHKG